MQRVRSKLQTSTKAISRAISPSFGQTNISFQTPQSIDVELCFAQHAKYEEVLRGLLPGGVIQLPAQPSHADSIFTEDNMIVRENLCLITQPGHEQRRHETDGLKEQLLRVDHQFDDIIDMKEEDSYAFCDGGDVLQMLTPDFPIFVGVDNGRTNERGLDVIAQHMNGGDVIPIRVPFEDEILHLKSVATWLDGEYIVCWERARHVFEQMQQRSGRDIRAIWVPDLPFANVLRVNDNVLVPTGFERSFQIIKSFVNKRGEEGVKLNLLRLDQSELMKYDAALTCCSVLI